MRGETNSNGVFYGVIDGDPHVRRLIERADRYLSEKDLAQRCSLMVERQGRWFMIAGRVDSHRTKTAIFGLVPEQDGAQWIVDRLHVGSR